MEIFMAKVNFAVQKRMLIMFALFLVGVVLIIGKLAYYQLIKGEEYKEKAAEQQTRDQSVDAKRGNIYDRNMKILAQSAFCEDVMINPRQIQQEIEKQQKKKAKAISEGEPFNEEDIEEKIVSNLVRILGVDEETLREDIHADYASRRVKKKVDQTLVNEIMELELPGVFFQKTTKRYYPYSSFASHIIGFVGDEGHGLEGLEKTLDSTLSGTAGRIQVVQDGRNNATPFEYENYIPPEDGKGVVLTIDEVIQHYVEKYLEEAYLKYDVRKGAAAIVMNPKTAEILAMAVEPNYDLNAPRAMTEEEKAAVISEVLTDKDGNELSENEKIQRYYSALWRNKAVCDTYEPGSTFKTITAASAIESGAVNPDTAAFFCNGAKKVATETIHCHKRAGHGPETFFKALENSCNPAFMEMGALLGRDRFKEYFEAFGFRDSTGFLLPGESKGIFFSDEKFNEVELATSSFGQGFAVTPLQMITAFSAVVNGGTLYKPQLVKAYTDNEGNITKANDPEIVRRVISESTSSIMRKALEGVVANGTGNGAYVAGYRIGGKTGTSEKQPRGNKKYVASFIGFAPADDPELVCLLLLDEPGGTLTGGGATAAPTVGKILADSLKYLGHEPQYSVKGEVQEPLTVPTLTGLSVTEATSQAEAAGFTVTVKGSGTEVLNQLPKGMSELKPGGMVILYTQTGGEETKSTVPDFTGMRKSEAEATAKAAGLNISISGGGEAQNVTEEMLAIGQSPMPGIEVIEGSTVTVDFAYNTNE